MMAVLSNVRTTKYNSVFLWLVKQKQDLEQKKCGIPSLNLDYAALVAETGFEPVTFGL